MSGIDGRLPALLWSMPRWNAPDPDLWMVRPRDDGFEIFYVCTGLWGRQTESTSIRAIGQFEMDIRKWVPGICYAPHWVRRLFAFPCRLILEMTKYWLSRRAPTTIWHPQGVIIVASYRGDWWNTHVQRTDKAIMWTNRLFSSNYVDNGLHTVSDAWQSRRRRRAPHNL
jgi:hypothetical protein